MASTATHPASRAARPSKGRSSQQGSALLLAPAGVLIVVLLGSIAIDSAAAFLAAREAEAVASSLANDLASLALDEAALRRSGAYRLDPKRLDSLGPWYRQAAEEGLSAVFEPGTVQVRARVIAPAAVQVTVSGEARRIIGMIANMRGAATRLVTARVSARARLSHSGWPG